MCYLYDTIHELFEAKELNIELYKEFVNKYRDNKNLIWLIDNTIKNRGWATEDLLELYDFRLKMCTSEKKYDGDGKYDPFDTLGITNSIKNDDVDEFSKLLINQLGDLNYSVNKLFKIIFYYGAVKCLKFILLQKDKDYLNKFIKKYCKQNSNNIDIEQFYNYHFVSNNAAIIKTIRTVIGFNESFEEMLLLDALNGFNFNVMESIENECKINNSNVFFKYKCHAKYLNNHTFEASMILYKNKLSKRELYKLNKKQYVYNVLKEYIDYLCEVTFDKDYDKELMSIIIAEIFTRANKYSDSFDLMFYNIDFFKPYDELYLAAFSNCDVDLSNNYIYKMLSQKNKDIIDIFVNINKIEKKPSNKLIVAMLIEAYKEVYSLHLKTIGNSEITFQTILSNYIELFNSAFIDIL